MVSPASPNYSVALSDDSVFIHYRSFASARNPGEMAERLRAAVAVGQANQLKRIMFDSRGVPFQAGIAAQYDYAYNQAWKHGLTRDWRIALLVSPGDTSYGFMETAFLNSGYIARLFDDHESAADWLRGPSSAPA